MFIKTDKKADNPADVFLFSARNAGPSDFRMHYTCHYAKLSGEQPLHPEKPEGN